MTTAACSVRTKKYGLIHREIGEAYPVEKHGSPLSEKTVEGPLQAYRYLSSLQSTTTILISCRLVSRRISRRKHLQSKQR